MIDFLPRASAVPTEYRGLFTYLNNRFADTVVLTFAQIEALLGFALPDLARLRQDWWATTAAGDGAATHSRSWSQALRTATANLPAQRVTFERIRPEGALVALIDRAADA